MFTPPPAPQTPSRPTPPLAALLAALEGSGRDRGRRRRTAALVAAGLFAAILALELAHDDQADALGNFSVLPVALLAFAFGLRGGVAGAGLALLLLAGADAMNENSALSPLGYLSRLTVYAVLGGALGHLAERLWLRADVERALLRAMSEMGDGLALADPVDHRLLYASPAAAELLRRERGTLPGLPLPELIHPAEWPTLAERVRLRRAGHPVSARAETVALDPAGTPVDLEAATVPVELAGAPYLVTVLRDISERRDFERRRRAEQGFLSAILATADCAVIVLDPEGRCVRANAGAERITGMPESALLGRVPWQIELVESADRASVADAFGGARLAAAGSSAHVSTWASRDGTRRWVDWRTTAIRDEAGELRYAIGIGIDISERRTAQARERQTRAALELRSVELARSNADLAHFASVASHDLREPLRAVSGFAELLRARAWDDLDPRARGWLEAIQGAAERMHALLDGLRTYGTIGRAQDVEAPVDLEGALGRVLADLAPELDAAEGEVSHDALPTVTGNQGQLEQVLRNLVGNALKYRNGAAPRVRVSARRRGTAWQVTVTDNGRGVPERHRLRIFEMFRRLDADDAVPGTGVGLAVCQRIVRRHGGDIWVEDAPEGGGSAFSFTVPDPEVRP